jgi:hypothetical protein
MCGATLLTVPEPVGRPPQRHAAAAPSPRSDAPGTRPEPVEEIRSMAPVADEARGISGPSFLGLNDPPPSKRASLSIDPHGPANSRNLEYLLDDDDEPKSSGAGKFVVIFVALALAVGLGYLRWKDQGFSWLNSPAKPSAASQNGDNSSSGTSPTDAQTPAASSSSTPAPTDAGKPAAPSPAAPPATTTPPATVAPAASPSTTPAGQTDTPKPTDAPPATVAAKPAAPASNEPAADTKPSAEDAPTTSDPADQPKPTADQPPPKPAAALRPVDPVAEAEKYLYGRGVAQNCDRGLRLLKGPANQGNPKAMVSMGALYSAGLCTAHDLPTAYRWFALALRKDPDNQSVQSDLQKLWGEMTQPERKLAIQMTQ